MRKGFFLVLILIAFLIVPTVRAQMEVVNVVGTKKANVVYEDFQYASLMVSPESVTSNTGIFEQEIHVQNTHSETMYLFFDSYFNDDLERVEIYQKDVGIGINSLFDKYETWGKQDHFHTEEGIILEPGKNITLMVLYETTIKDDGHNGKWNARIWASDKDNWTCILDNTTSCLYDYTIDPQYFINQSSNRATVNTQFIRNGQDNGTDDQWHGQTFLINSSLNENVTVDHIELSVARTGAVGACWISIWTINSNTSNLTNKQIGNNTNFSITALTGSQAQYNFTFHQNAPSILANTSHAFTFACGAVSADAKIYGATNSGGANPYLPGTCIIKVDGEATQRSSCLAAGGAFSDLYFILYYNTTVAVPATNYSTNIQNVTWVTPVTESTWNNFTINLSWGVNVTNITAANITYNGTVYLMNLSSNGTLGVNNTWKVFNATLLSPPVTANLTSVPFNFTYYILFDNGSTQLNITGNYIQFVNTSLVNRTVTIQNVSWTTPIFEGQNAQPFLINISWGANVTNVGGVNLTYNNAVYPATNLLNGTIDNNNTWARWNVSGVFAPFIAVNQTNITFNWTYYVVLDNATTMLNTSNNFIQVILTVVNSSITAFNRWNGSAILIFNATVINSTDSFFYNTTNGTIVTNLSAFTTSLFNVTINSSTYLNQTYIWNTSTTLNATLFQSEIRFTVFDAVTLLQITSYTIQTQFQNFSSNASGVATVRVNNGSIQLSINQSGYAFYQQNHTFGALGNTTGIIFLNASYNVIILKESSGSKFNVNETNSTTLYVYCANNVTQYNFNLPANDNTLNISLSCPWLFMKLGISYTTAGNYFRTLIPPYNTSIITFYAIDLNNETAVTKTFTLSDLTENFINGTVRFSKILNGSDVIIDKQLWDIEEKVIVTLILYNPYIITLTNNNNATKVLGYFVADATANHVINPTSINFAPTQTISDFQWQYIPNLEQGWFYMAYQSTNGTLFNVTWLIQNASNTSQVFLNTTFTTITGSANFTSIVNGTVYLTTLIFNSASFSVHQDIKQWGALFLADLANIFSGFDYPSEAKKWFGFIIVVAGALAFSGFTMGVAAVWVAGMTTFFSWIGFFVFGAYAAWILAFIWVIAAMTFFINEGIR